MRNRIIGLVLLCSLGWVGCGHVAANYPQPKRMKLKELPKKFEANGKAGVLTWKEEGKIHGFSNRVVPASEMQERMEKFAEAGSAIASRDAKIFAQMAGRDLCFIQLIVFLSYGEERDFGRGDFLVEFKDGSSVRDDGAYLYGLIQSGTNPESTFAKKVHLAADYDPEMKGRTLFLFFPSEHLGKVVASVELAAQDS